MLALFILFALIRQISAEARNKKMTRKPMELACCLLATWTQIS